MYSSANLFACFQSMERPKHRYSLYLSNPQAVLCLEYMDHVILALCLAIIRSLPFLHLLSTWLSVVLFGVIMSNFALGCCTHVWSIQDFFNVMFCA